MNIRVLMLLGCVLALPVHAQESRRDLWTWTDANGVTHFSDRPVPGARRVEITTTAPAPQAAPATPAAADASAPSASRAAAAVAYRSLEIWQPESDESFFGADAQVNVRMRSDPELATGHTLRLFLDGRLIEGATNAESFTLENLDRGAHSLTAVINDERGNELIRSAKRTFFIRQPTVNPPANVGPSLRPAPPRPTPVPNAGPRG